MIVVVAMVNAQKNVWATLLYVIFSINSFIEGFVRPLFSHPPMPRLLMVVATEPLPGAARHERLGTALAGHQERYDR